MTKEAENAISREDQRPETRVSGTQTSPSLRAHVLDARPSVKRKPSESPQKEKFTATKRKKRRKQARIESQKVAVTSVTPTPETRGRERVAESRPREGESSTPQTQEAGRPSG